MSSGRVVDHQWLWLGKLLYPGLDQSSRSVPSERKERVWERKDANGFRASELPWPGLYAFLSGSDRERSHLLIFFVDLNRKKSLSFSSLDRPTFSNLLSFLISSQSNLGTELGALSIPSPSSGRKIRVEDHLLEIRHWMSEPSEPLSCPFFHIRETALVDGLPLQSGSKIRKKWNVSPIEMIAPWLGYLDLWPANF